MRRVVFGIVLIGAAMLPSVAGAQGVAGQPTREEIERAPVLPRVPSNNRLAIDGEVERAPCPLADAAYKDITVDLREVRFSGLGTISADTLRGSWSGYAGQKVPIATVCEIRDRAATTLRQAGYLAAVQVPPQRIEGGVVNFDVLLAKLAGFQVRGAAGKSEGIIGRYLKALQDQPVFNIRFAERYLLLARDLPGYDIRLTLRPAGTVPGEVIGEVQVVRTPVEVDFAVQNYGSQEVGRGGGILQARFNGIFGLGDRTTLGVFSTHDFREQQVVQVGQEIRVGGEGLTLGADVSYALTRPTLGAGISLKSETLVATVRATYPVIRRQTFNLNLGGGIDFVNQSSSFNGIPFTRDWLRVPFVKLDYDAFDPKSVVSTTGYSIGEPRWRVGASLELRHGLDALGASPDCRSNAAACVAGGAVPPSRLTADPSGFVVRAGATFEFRPIPIIGFSLSPRVQYSPSTLLSYEQFSAGNYTVGRGFDPGTLIGDSGVGVRGEVFAGSLIPSSRKGFAFQGYAFVDAAWVWNHDPLPGLSDPQKLQSAGGGVRVAFGDRFLFDAGVAVPFAAAGLQTARGDTRLLVSLTTRLFPLDRP
ncbi:ShlB/FhaC/HecB family hemolysin secretion/activation protein [Sphingomonas sp. SUN039]|uniref:ShlB/FhaC/HecB family hemolysin secretion/activation protein n=1 Tax=Sphingomonas sp. SUN039 TaxID=2937787 RepID=UPI002164BFC4|nr:ShlB/FhaC/HecB family hemolysin secretion/activation protein [Sphingomonas sp. SUN039]UVO53385.1 ShlB/FhaC/HecB family hemolysin secretion/activation protein [Sphingomonas sp. SUN039]